MSNQFFSASWRASSSRWDTNQINITQLYDTLNLAMMPAFKLLFTAVPSKLKNTTFFKSISVFITKSTFYCIIIHLHLERLVLLEQRKSFGLNSLGSTVHSFLTIATSVLPSERTEIKFAHFNFSKSFWSQHSGAFCIKSLHAVSFS